MAERSAGATPSETPTPTDVSPEAPSSIDATIATLASYLDPDGGLRVPSLTVVDERDRPLVVVRAANGITEVSVGLPSSPGESTEVRLFAHDGEPGDPDAASTFGMELVARGDCIYDLSALSERPGEWVLSEWAEQSLPRHSATTSRPA